MKQAVVFVAEGFEEIEALTPVDYLRRSGINVTMIKVSGKNTDLMVKSSHGVSICVDTILENYIAKTKDNLPDAVILPGGMPGSENLGSNKDLIDFIGKVNSENKFICAICAAPIAVLSQTGLLAKRHYTCSPGWEEKLDKYIPDENNRDKCMDGSYLVTDKASVIDGNLITACGAGAAASFSFNIVKKLLGKDAVELLKKQICLR